MEWFTPELVLSFATFITAVVGAVVTLRKTKETHDLVNGQSTEFKALQVQLSKRDAEIARLVGLREGGAAERLITAVAAVPASATNEVAAAVTEGAAAIAATNEKAAEKQHAAADKQEKAGEAQMRAAGATERAADATIKAAASTEAMNERKKGE